MAPSSTAVSRPCERANPPIGRAESPNSTPPPNPEVAPPPGRPPARPLSRYLPRRGAGPSHQEVQLRQRQPVGRLAGRDLAVDADQVGFRVDLDPRSGVVAHHVALADPTTVAHRHEPP